MINAKNTVYPKRFLSVFYQMNLTNETAQEVYEFSRRGRLDELSDIIKSVHPDKFLAYDGSTALLMACKNGHQAICELLVKHGADLSKRGDDGSSSLFLAVCSGNLGLVRFVLSQRPDDINECNEDGFTAMDMAVLYNYAEVMEELKSRGAVRSGIETPETGEFHAVPSEKWGYGVFD